MGSRMIGRSIVSVFSALIGVFLLLCAGAVVLIYVEDSPLPNEWNPIKPLVITDPKTALTDWKLVRTLADGELCKAALGTGAKFSALPDKIDSLQCGIRDHVTVTQVAGAKVTPVNTRCQTALRLAMWAGHDLQPKATEIFDQSIREIRHYSSYNCRSIRTSSDSTSRMSTHATAEAIDISGFVLQDGTSVDLKSHWNESASKSEFLQAANRSACKWFRLTLGPNYNALHADHFHLQHTGWGACR